MRNWIFVALFLSKLCWGHVDCDLLFEKHQNTASAQGYFSSILQRIIVKKKTRPGLGHGKIYTVKRFLPFMSWFSIYQKHQGALQGSPRWIEEIYGKKVAEFFGFKQLDKYNYEIPNADHLNAAIDIINHRLKADKLEPISLKFYSAEDRVRIEEYLRRFAEEGALPVSEGTPSMVHDVSYHVGGIALPQKVIEHARLLTKYVNDFAFHSGANLSPKDKHDITFERLRHVDEGSANSLVAIMGYYSPKMFDYNILKLTQEGDSPYLYFQRLRKSYRDNEDVVNAIDAFVVKHFHEPNFHRLIGKQELQELCKLYSENMSKIKKYVE